MVEPLFGTTAFLPKTVPVEHGAGEVWPAAFKLYNPVYNALQYLHAPAFDPDPNFDLPAAAKKSKLWDRYSGRLSQAQSQAEFDALEQKIWNQEQMEQIVGGSGFTGILASVVTGSLSPTLLIPAVGAVRGSKAIYDAGRLAALAASIDEVPIILNHVNYTAQDAMIGIGGATAFGMIVGGAVAAFSRGAAAKMAADLAHGVEVKPRSYMWRRPDGGVGVGGDAAEVNLPGMPFGSHSPSADLAAKAMEGKLFALVADLRTVPPAINGVTESAALNVSNAFAEHVRARGTDVASTLRNLDAEGEALLRNIAHEAPPGQTVDYIYRALRMAVQPGDNVAEQALRSAADHLASVAFGETKVVRGARVVDNAPEFSVGGKNLPRLITNEKLTPEMSSNFTGRYPDSAPVINELTDVLNDALVRVGDTEPLYLNALVKNAEFEHLQKVMDDLAALYPGQAKEKVLADFLQEKFDISPSAAITAARKIQGIEQAARTSAPAQTGGSVSAARVGEQEDPVIHFVDPETGKVTVVNALENADGTRAFDNAESTGIGNLTLVGRIAARLNPVIRGIEQWGMVIKSPTLSHYIRMLSDGGVQHLGSERGIATAAGGTVEAQKSFYDGRLYVALDSMARGYVKYLAEVEEPTVTDIIAAKRRMTLGGAPNGKLSYAEFKQRVMDANNRGDVDASIPQVTEAAQIIRREFYQKIEEAANHAARARGVKSMWPELKADAEGMLTYATHIYDEGKIAANREEFVADFGDHIARAMSEVYGERIANFNTWKAKQNNYRELLQLSEDEAKYTLKAIDHELESLKEQLSDVPELEEISALRRQADEIFEEEYEKVLMEQWPIAITKEDAVDEARKRALITTHPKRKPLLDAAKAMEEDLPDDIKEMLDRQREIRADRGFVARSFGALQTKQARLIERAEKNTGKNLDKLDKLIAAAERVGSQTDAAIKAEMAKLTKVYERDLGLIEKDAKRQELLDRRLAETDNATATLLLDQKQRTRALRAEKAFEKLAEMERMTPDEIRAKLREQVIELRNEVDRINSNRAARNEKIQQRFKKLNPEQALVARDRLEERILTREQRMLDQIAEAGGEAPNLATGAVDFTEKARDYARDLSYKITGNPSRLDHLDYLAELRGSMRRRVLNMPYERKKKWLQGDAEKVLSAYTRKMYSDIELFRITGSRNANNARLKIQDEMKAIAEVIATRATDEKGVAITEARRAKEIAKHNHESKQMMYLFDGLVERIQGMRGIPANPEDLAYRIGRFFMNWNVTTYMGSAAITSIPDAARGVMMHGFANAFADSWRPFVAGLVDESQRKLNKEALDVLRDMGIGVDTLLHSRSRGTFDFGDPVPYSKGFFGKIESSMDWLAHKMPNIALFGPWTDLQQQVTGLMSMARLVRGIRAVAEGNPTEAHLRYLAASGINPRLARNIHAQFVAPGGATKFNNTWLPNIEAWTDYEAARAFQAAMGRETERALNVPGLERPLFVDKDIFHRVLFQFTNFTFAAHSKTLLAGLQTRGIEMFHTITGMAFSLALGALSYYLWAMTTSSRTREEMRKATWQQWLDQATYRSGITGAFEIPRKIGAEIPATRRFVTFSDKELAGRRADNMFEAIGGPTVGKLMDMFSFIQGLDDPTQGTVNQGLKMIPYQNVFYIRDGLKETALAGAKAAGLPESRR